MYTDVQLLNRLLNLTGKAAWMPSFKNVRPCTFLNYEFFYRKTRFCLETLTSCQRSDVLGVRLKLAVNTDTDVRGSAQKRCFLLEQKTRRPTKYTDVFCWVGHGCTFFIRGARPAASQDRRCGCRDRRGPETHERRCLHRETSSRRGRRGHHRKQHQSDPARL